MKKIISFILALIMIGSTIRVYAKGCDIECTAKITGRECTISGQINNHYGNTKVSILVGNVDDVSYITENDAVLYIYVATTSYDGKFSFDFRMPENTPTGTYSYYVGYDKDVEVYEGTIDYVNPDDYVTNKFIDADMSISISGYVPTIAGTISCTEGKTVSIDIINNSDNTVLASDSITEENTVVSYTLPSLLSAKEYEITIACTDGESELMRVYANIDSSILLVEATGEIVPAENVEIDLQLESTGLDLLNQDKKITTTETFSSRIPNLVSNASVMLSIQGYETVLSDGGDNGDDGGDAGDDDENEGNEGSGDNEGGSSDEGGEEILTSTLIIEGETNDVFYIVANVENGTMLNNKIYKIIYNEDHIEVESVLGYLYEELSGGQEQRYIRILSNDLGEISFQIINMDDVNEKVWSGALNVFRFRFLEDYSGETEIIVNEWIGE